MLSSEIPRADKAWIARRAAAPTGAESQTPQRRPQAMSQAPSPASTMIAAKRQVAREQNLDNSPQQS